MATLRAARGAFSARPTAPARCVASGTRALLKGKGEKVEKVVEGEKGGVPSLGKKGMVDQLHKAGLSRDEASLAFDTFINTVTETLSRGEKVSFVGFGTFEVKDRKERNGRNPATGAAMKIPATKAPTFKASSQLKDVVNGRAPAPVADEPAKPAKAPKEPKAPAAPKAKAPKAVAPAPPAGAAAPPAGAAPKAATPKPRPTVAPPTAAKKDAAAPPKASKPPTKSA